MAKPGCAGLFITQCMGLSGGDLAWGTGWGVGYFFMWGRVGVGLSGMQACSQTTKICHGEQVLCPRCCVIKDLYIKANSTNGETNIHVGITHWGWVTYICVSKLTIIGSDNGLPPGRRQAIIWTNAGILLIRPFSEILVEIYTISFKKMHFKMSAGKYWTFCLGLNVINSSTIPSQVPYI